MKNDSIGMKNYIRIAKNRAIDAALIRYLDLPTVEGKLERSIPVQRIWKG